MGVEEQYKYYKFYSCLFEILQGAQSKLMIKIKKEHKTIGMFANFIHSGAFLNQIFVERIKVFISVQENRF